MTKRKNSKTKLIIQKPSRLTFAELVKVIGQVHQTFFTQAAKAVNISLTLRNWLMGYYIYMYEQKGSDRAAYGEQLLEKLSKKLQAGHIPRTSSRELRRYRLFSLFYPQIWETVSPKLDTKQPIWETPSPKLQTPAKILLNQLSFSHFSELISTDDPLKRVFYEHECIRGNWSVRELKRQMATLYFERSGLSKNPKKLASLVAKKAELFTPEQAIKEAYSFEFLGFKAKDAVSEGDIEDAMLGKLQDFILELGHGFCFEARQKRLVIGGDHCFVDLVFYHRILKCHVLIELKADEFKHEYLGQMNTYVSWFRKHAMSTGDNPPVGILLCTQKNHAMVEYALAGMNNKLFVSKYQLELPKKEKIRKFLEEQLRAHAGQR